MGGNNKKEKVIEEKVVVPEEKDEVPEINEGPDEIPKEVDPITDKPAVNENINTVAPVNKGSTADDSEINIDNESEVPAISENFEMVNDEHYDEVENKISELKELELKYNTEMSKYENYMEKQPRDKILSEKLSIDNENFKKAVMEESLIYDQLILEYNRIRPKTDEELECELREQKEIHSDLDRTRNEMKEELFKLTSLNSLYTTERPNIKKDLNILNTDFCLLNLSIDTMKSELENKETIYDQIDDMILRAKASKRKDTENNNLYFKGLKETNIKLYQKLEHLRIQNNEV